MVMVSTASIYDIDNCYHIWRAAHRTIDLNDYLTMTTFKNDGSFRDAVVTESSEYASLDRNALKLMQRVYPIRLRHDFAQSHTEVFVPVHYRLD